MPLYDSGFAAKCTKEELAAWKKEAAAVDMPLNTWIRMLLNAASGRPFPPPAVPSSEQIQRATAAAQSAKKKTKKAKKAKGGDSS